MSACQFFKSVEQTSHIDRLGPSTTENLAHEFSASVAFRQHHAKCDFIRLVITPTIGMF